MKARRARQCVRHLTYHSARELNSLQHLSIRRLLLEEGVAHHGSNMATTSAIQAIEGLEVTFVERDHQQAGMATEASHRMLRRIAIAFVHGNLTATEQYPSIRDQKKRGFSPSAYQD